MLLIFHTFAIHFSTKAILEMKKHLFLFVLAFIGIAGTVFGQTPATLPYGCDFESPGDNGWTLKNGSCTNQWHIGTPSGAENASLHISGDNGTTTVYNTGATSVVVAEKLFQTDESDYLSVSFDLTIGGEGQFDYLKVFWVPADTNYEATTNYSVYYAQNDYTPNVIMSNATYATHRLVCNLLGTQRMTAIVANEPNSLKKLVFVWTNDNSGGNQPGAIIDNIRIAPACPPITDLTINNITETSAEVSWNGGSSSYEVRINGGASETVTTASKTFTGLTPGTAYKVEVRGICSEASDDNWQAITFYTTQIPATLPYTCDFEAEGNNGWIIKDGTHQNKWFIGTPAGETSRSLYISGDGGATAGLVQSNETNNTLVVAEKLFRTGASEYINISFDLHMDERFMNATFSFTALRVFWAPVDSIFEATASYSAACASLNRRDNIIMNNYTEDSSLFITVGFGERTEMNTTIVNEPNSLKKLVFIYMCGGYGSFDGFEPPIIDNISITGVDEQCEAPTDLLVSNISQSEATVSWNGSATSYEVRLNSGEIETVSGTSKTFTGLTPGEPYSVQVRTICQESRSQWESVNFSTPQYPTSIPYFCDFEAAGNNGWILKNGYCTNSWYIGTPDSATNASLYISGDGGTTAGYKTDEYSIVVAEKLFQTGTSDSLTISFDLTIGGEYACDYLKVFWVPADTNYEATINEDLGYYAECRYATNLIMNNSTSTYYRYVNMLEGMQRLSVSIANEPNSLKKLVFVWKNSHSGGVPPGAIIDNISIGLYCSPVVDLSAGNITATSAEINWNGSATNYEVRLNGGAVETVTSTSKTFTDLTELTDYTVEVRAVCTDSKSVWDTIRFTTPQIPTALPYACDFEAEGNNGWVLKNGTCTNQWHIGTPSEAESASLFISGDGGTTAGYNTNAESTVVAEKLFQTGTSDSLTISFDLTIGGEYASDYLKVFWVPADTNYEASNGYIYHATTSYATNTIMKTGDRHVVNRLQGTQRMTATIANEPNSLKKLVFVWRNDYFGGDGIGAIIDNINVDTYCSSVSDLAVSNITATSAEVSWNGSASNYEVRLNGGVAETVTTTSKTFTNLTEETEYIVEVRAVCSDSESEWDTVRFTTASNSGLEQVASSMEVLIYPNPAKDKAVLRLSGLMEDARLIVGDIQGKIVMSDSIAKGSERYELDLKGFASGVYSVTIVSGNNKTTHKLIVE